VGQTTQRSPSRRVGGWVPEGVLVVGGIILVIDLVVLVRAGGDLPYGLSLCVGYAGAWIVRIARPHLPISLFFVGISGLSHLTLLSETLIGYAEQHQPDPTTIAWLNLVGGMAGAVGSVAMAFALAFFPEGYAGSRWQARAMRVTLLALLVPPLVTLTSSHVPLPLYANPPRLPNPLHLGPVSITMPVADAATGLGYTLPLLLGLVILVVRYRGAEPDIRARIRWILVPLVLLVLFSGMYLLGANLVATWFVMIASDVVGTMVAVIAILAPPRLDADAALVKLVVFGFLWLVIAGAYVGAAAVVGVAAGRALPVDWAVGLALVAAVGFQPLRSRLERLADRWVFGRRTDPAQVVGRLGSVLAQTFDLENLLALMAETLSEGLDLAWARVEISGSPPDDAALVTPVTLDGEELGYVACGPKRHGTWTAEDRDVVATFAHQAGLAVRNVRLTRKLAEHVTELGESQARLVRAQEAERRRIERNIHDGVQQELVALMGEVGLAGRRAQRADQHEMAQELTKLRGGLQRLLNDLRELAAGVHPNLLTDHGLPAAVEALVKRHPIPVDLQIAAEVRATRLSEEVEGAAYFTVAEAMANSLKYARAHHLQVELTRPDGLLLVRVTDDGVGIATESVSGQGLANLAARANALGGHLDVVSAPDVGTEVTAAFAAEAAR
jgi:signal transduction histidine kinase